MRDMDISEAIQRGIEAAAAMEILINVRREIPADPRPGARYEIRVPARYERTVVDRVVRVLEAEGWRVRVETGGIYPTYLYLRKPKAPILARLWAKIRRKETA